MENSSPQEDPLERLTEAERQVYDEICRAWIEDEKYITAREIGSVLIIGEDESRRRLTRIYEKLGITGTEQEKRVRLIVNFCLKTNLASESTSEAPPQETEEPPEALQKPTTTGIDIEPPGGRINRRAVAQRLALILGGLVIMGIIGFLVFRGDEPTASLTDQPIPTDTISLTSRETPLPSHTQPSPTIFETVVATAPLVVAQVLPDTASPTETLAPTDTPAPTFTPTQLPAPTPTIIPLGFEDQFGDGLSDDWEVLFGKPLILDQAYLTSQGDNLFIAYGDTRWTDYEVEIGIHTAISGIDHGNFIAVRMTDNHFIAVGFSGTGGRFWENDGGSWTRIPGTQYDNSSLRGETVRVVVRQNEIIAYVKGIQVKSITTTYPNGRVGLKMVNGSRITYFVVRELQP